MNPTGPAGMDPAPDPYPDASGSVRHWGISSVSGLAEHWGLVLAYGLLTVGLGVVLVLWPRETLVVCAVLVAVQLLAAGVMRIVMAAWSTSTDSAGRVLLGLTGAIALVVGLLCLRDPVQSLVVLGIVIGAWWLVSGVADIVGAVLSSSQDRRTWAIAGGFVSVLAGGFLLVNPDTSLRILVIVLCVWLLLVGGVAIVASLRLRAHATSSSDVPSVPPRRATTGEPSGL